MQRVKPQSAIYGGLSPSARTDHDRGKEPGIHVHVHSHQSPLDRFVAALNQIAKLGMEATYYFGN
jgi:diaminopimelate decarboxylase